MDFRDVGNFRILSWEVGPPDGGCHNGGTDGVATLAFLPSSGGGRGGSRVRGMGVRGGAGAWRKRDSEGSEGALDRCGRGLREGGGGEVLQPQWSQAPYRCHRHSGV